MWPTAARRRPSRRCWRSRRRARPPWPTCGPPWPCCAAPRSAPRRPARGRLPGPGRAADQRGVQLIRVVLADDQVLVRAGFRLLLETEDGFEVCGEAADGHEAVALARSQRPDVVVMDIRMPRLDGL